jgi:aminopeptidase
MIALALGELHARHAHMPGITARMMTEGMRADYNTVNALSLRVYETVRRAKTIHVTAPDGTDLLARFDEQFRWTSLGGLYPQAGAFGNLPEGEVCTCPASVEGVFVAKVLGDYFSARYGVLQNPVTIEIADAHIQTVQSARQDIADELTAYLDANENGRRVGEFAIGTNTGVTALCGAMLQDEKIPGVHIAFGDPLSNYSGADWSSTVHVDAVNPGCTIEVDGKLLMKAGQFVF